MELEAKFSLDPAAAEALGAIEALGDYQLGEVRVNTDVDQYLDTSDYRILRGGYACRLRERNGRPIATLKSLSPSQTELHRREEYETPLEPGAGDPASWPDGPARALALQLTDGATLETLFMLWQQRQVRPIRQDDRLVAEWSLDRVETTVGDTTDAYSELEIELKDDGTEEDLHRLADAVRDQPGVTPQPLSKFERAIQMLDGMADLAADDETSKAKGKPSPGVRADDSMAEAGRKILRFHFNRMLKDEGGARRGEDIEAVHTMRVATRRMRSALALFAPYYRPKVVKKIGQGLKLTARALGGVRDLDVFLERAEAYRGHLSETKRRELDPMFKHWHKRRDTARTAMTRWLDSPEFRHFVEDFRVFVETPEAAVAKPTAEGVQPTLVRHLAPGLIWNVYARVRAYEDILAEAPLATVHALRIEGKRLRYTLEFFAEDLGKRSDTLVAQVTAMQDHLGNLNDADVDVRALTDFLTQHDGKPAELPGVRAYLNTRLADRGRLRARLDQVWQPVAGPRFRRYLGQATASL